MAAWLIAAIGFVYLFIGCWLLFVDRKPGLALSFIGYAIGNAGLFAVAKGIA